MFYERNDFQRGVAMPLAMTLGKAKKNAFDHFLDTFMHSEFYESARVQQSTSKGVE